MTPQIDVEELKPALPSIGKYDPVIEFVNSRIDTINRSLKTNEGRGFIISDGIDNACLIELEGVIKVCEILNRQEALINGAIFGGAA